MHEHLFVVLYKVWKKHNKYHDNTIIINVQNGLPAHCAFFSNLVLADAHALLMRWASKLAENPQQCTTALQLSKALF